MSSRYAAHTSSFPRSAPVPTRSPMPTKRAHVDDTVRIVRTLPKGYDFVPPHAPLTYPASYHLIPAGPQNAPRKKRAVFQTLTNFAGRVTVLRDAVGRKCLTDALDLAIRWWRGLSCISGWALFRHRDTYGGESGFTVRRGSARMSRWSADTSRFCFSFELSRRSDGNRTQSHLGAGGSYIPSGYDGFLPVFRTRIWAPGDHILIGFWGIKMAFFHSNSNLGSGGVYIDWVLWHQNGFLSLELEFGFWGSIY
ncbi:hypothetical protein B0H11DRAFT_1929917 [Mycena galericulata]|nr:hypothetical protein B0H11DRAFT_1929917 [Mycena galericulata]